MDPLVSGALVTGLLGSGHCIGMCGGLVAALGLSGGRRAGLTYHVLYNLGRISTYALLGYFVGWLGLAVAQPGALRGAGRVLMLGADLFVLLVSSRESLIKYGRNGSRFPGVFPAGSRRTVKINGLCPEKRQRLPGLPLL